MKPDGGVAMVSYKKQIIFLTIVVLICIALIFFIYTEVKKNAFQELNERQMTYAQLAAKGIESVLDHHIAILQILARNQHIILMDSEGKSLLQEGVQRSGSLIKGITRVNARGEIIYTFPAAAGVIGRNISGQAHVRDVWQTKKLVVSDIFDAVQGFKSVAIHMPVYRANTFDGSIAFLISFNGLAKTYLDNLHVPDERYVQLINAHGKIIYCVDPEHLGVSWVELYKENPEAVAVIDRIMKGERGVATFIGSHSKGSAKKAQRLHAVYTPVRVGSGHWSVIVMSSERNLLPAFHNIKRGIILLALMLIAFFTIAVYVAARIRSASIETHKRQKIEEDLVKSALEINDLYHNAPCGYHSLDTDGKIVRINDMEASWLGYSRDSLIGRPFVDFMTLSSRERFAAAFDQLKKEGLVLNIEYELIRKDGSSFPVLVTASAVTDPRGNFIMSRSMVLDMTRRRAQEQRLRESETLYRTALETTSDGISITQNRKYVFVNKKLMETIGRPDENLIGKTAGVYIHPDDRHLLLENFLALQQGLPMPNPEYNLRILKPDGSIVMVSVINVQITYQGQPATLAFITDITDQKKHEEALQEGETLYRTALEATSDGVTIVQEGVYVYVNQKFLATMGIAREDILNKPLGILAGSNAQQGLRDFLQSHPQKEPAPDRHVTRVRKPDGSKIYLQSSSVDIVYRGKPAILTFIQDVTESRKAEQVLRESEELYRTALESTSDGVTIVQKGKYVYVSQRLLNTIGQPNLNLVGTMQDTDIHPGDWAKVVDAYERRHKGDPLPTDYELRVTKPDGSTVYLHIHTVLVKYYGAPAILSFIRDITKQKEAENALRESETLYRTALENVSDGITIADIQDGKYLYVNTKLMQTLGRPGEDVTGSPVDVYVHPDDVGLGRKYYLERKKEGKIASNFESRLIRPDGSIAMISVRATDIVFKGRKAVISFVQDITARKKAEEALRESETFYRTALENTSDGISIIDIQAGRYLYVNQRLMQTIGRPGEDVTGQPADIYLHPDDVGMDRQIYKALKASGRDKISYEIRVLAADGSTVTLGVTATETRYQGKRAIISFITNITERKKAENALRESEELYRTSMEKTNDGISIIQDGKYVYANQKLLKTIGREEGIIGLPVGIYTHPDDREVVKGHYEARRRGEWAPLSYDARIVKPDGSIVYSNIKAVSIIYKGRPATIAFSLDITERKKAEEALRKSEERYRSIIESIDDEYFETDLAGNITFFNKKISWTGHTYEEFIGLSYRQYTSPEMSDKISKAFNTVYKENRVVRITDHQVLHKDGRSIYLDINVSPIRDASGKPVGFRGISRDVSERYKMEEERKKLTEQLYQAQKMEAIGTLAGGIAHDFNNLLMGIQGYTSIMLLEVDASHPHYEQLKSVQTLVQSGASLTKQLLGFARAGRYEVVPTNLNDMIRKSIGLFGRTKKEIRVFEKYAENIWTVEADRGQIEQVLLNMYVNAWQAMPGGGSLYLETENVTMDNTVAKLRDLKPGRYVKISITDTGVGMDEKTRQRIFDPFFTTKEMGRGTGLGLASAYGIIKGHSGLITVYSEKSEGTTFNIYLPASTKAVPSEETAESEMAGGRETILLVDDEEVITDVTGRLLTELGYQIITANSGREAVETYRQKHAEIDLVIIDMIMPGMSGSDTFDQLKTINPSIRAILSSGYSLNGKAQAIMDKGVRVFLQKPYRLHDLAQKIREALSA